MSINKLLIIFFFIILLFSCKTHTYSKFSVNKKEIYLGDSILVSWVTAKPKQFSYATLNGEIEITKSRGDTFIRVTSDTLITLAIYNKKGKRLLSKRKKVKVLTPQILSFSAFRDRFNPDTVELAWATKDINNLSIEGYEDNLKPTGVIRIQQAAEEYFNLVGTSPFDTIIRTCFISAPKDEEVFVVKDTSINDLPEGRDIRMKIIESDISNYPSEIKLKVIVYDSLGNFITDLAEPFGKKEISDKYFKKVVEKSGKKIKDVKFKVTEIHDSPNKFDVALTLDYSGSMSDDIQTLENATEYFIKKKYKDDNYSIVKYDNNLKKVCPLTNNIEALIKNGNFYQEDMGEFGGGTALYAAVGKGTESLQNAKNEKVVILFTDGYENSSLEYVGKYPVNPWFVANNLRSNNTRMISIGLGDVNKPLLRELSYCTNGTFYKVKYPSNIKQVYKELQHNFRTYYEITIKPIVADGEHIIQIVYDNRIDSAIAERPYYINYIPPEISNVDIDTSSYWYDKSMVQKKYKLAFQPQALVNFQLDADNIQKEYARQLNNMAKYFKANPSLFIQIYGHTDSQGSDEYNMDLSKKRAKAIRDYFVRRGVKSSQIKWKGMGKTQLLYPDDEEEWMAKENRRVEIIIWQKQP